MFRYGRLIPQTMLAVVLFLLCTGVSEGRADKQEIKVATEVVDKLVGGAKLDEVAKLVKTTSLEALMNLYLPQKKGGYGVGPKGDGIENRLQNLSKKGIPPTDLPRESDDLIKAAQRSKAISEFNDLFTPKEKIGKKDPRLWKKYNEEVKKGADELIEAIKKGDTKKIQAAAKFMEIGCNECHTVFR